MPAAVEILTARLDVKVDGFFLAVDQGPR